MHTSDVYSCKKRTSKLGNKECCVTYCIICASIFKTSPLVYTNNTAQDKTCQETSATWIEVVLYECCISLKIQYLLKCSILYT